MILSKSNYLLYLKHPAWLWLEKHDKSKLPEVDEDTQAIFDAGNLFESYAEKLFPDGVTLGYKTDGEFDSRKYKALPEETKQAIENNVKVIFQGRFEIDSTTCIFDVLERNENGTYNLYEIKSSTKVKKEHEHDLAFQTIVLEKSGLKIENIFVIHVNNEYVRDGEIDYKEITIITEVTSAVRSRIEETIVSIEDAKAVMALTDMPDPSPRHTGLGAYREWLEIYKILNPNLDKYSVLNLSSPGTKRIGDFEDDGITTISDIPDDANLTVKQRRQVSATKSGKRSINKKEIKAFLKAFRFPLYFLDYETLAGVIPTYDGVRPYQQIPFQYSLHVLESPDTKLEHKEYLHTKNTLPVEHLLKKLKKDIGTKGSIVVWYQSFEKSCNMTMAEFTPKYKNFLVDINDRIVDLMTPFAEGWYVDKDFFGSASIKDVMPVLIPDLSYKDLHIQGGNSAQRIWMETVINGKNQDNKKQIMDDMIKYCTLDTLAMVKIYEVLRKSIL
ncbi:DUF2779 domain-containing protein [Patescibacteria group bacterium]|nr:DUF2779 domain-containing protein [Patescibacteria group bacterium]